eukprot:TRINITY_DN30527_c0_g1_i1.p1 TRINITY_DN30527_c0_g1~~TRINITY_DN30527_c0_g1_i1.p1  ORF type:complete len:558 (-),score=81.23 TRINITY_DN30527_c0_g1_i1:269-1942(-)
MSKDPHGVTLPTFRRARLDRKPIVIDQALLPGSTFSKSSVGWYTPGCLAKTYRPACPDNFQIVAAETREGAYVAYEPIPEPPPIYTLTRTGSESWIRGLEALRERDRRGESRFAKSPSLPSLGSKPGSPFHSPWGSPPHSPYASPPASPKGNNRGGVRIINGMVYGEPWDRNHRSPHSSPWGSRPGSPGHGRGPPQIKKREVRRFTKENMPKSCQALDFWRAQECYRIADLQKQGHLNKDGFHKLMKLVLGDKEKISRKECDAIYVEIDLDDSDSIEMDEWLGWVFSTHSNYCGGIRKRLAGLQESKIVEFYRFMDRDGSGTIDKDEFAMFMDKFSPEEMSREATDELFEFIDVDNSGEIDLDEFLDWLRPGRKEERLKKKLRWKNPTDEDVQHLDNPDTARSSGSKNMPKDPAELAQPQKQALFEAPPRTAITLEFHYGPTYGPTLAQVERNLRKMYDESMVLFKRRLDKKVATVSKVVAKVGRGIVLWDRYTMLAFQDDPFVSIATAKIWIARVMADAMPDVIAAGNLKRIQAIRLEKKKQKQEAEARKRMAARS